MSDRVRDLLKSAKENEADFEFASAKKAYFEIATYCSDSEEAKIAERRLAAIDELIKEKQIYQRIDENAKKVLTDIGVNVAGNQRLMDILMAAGAVNFESDLAIFMPLKRDYLDACLEKVDKHMVGDPGMNAFGTGATAPFLKRPDEEDLRPATGEEYREIVSTVSSNSDVVKIFSQPVATDKSISGYEVAKCMDEGFRGLKMIAAKSFADDEMVFLKGKADWLDGTSLISSLTQMDTMVDPFIRSAKTGGNLLLLDLTIAGSSGPGSPEALLTQVHAQVMFMMVMAQTVNPGVPCVHGGIPGVVEAGGDLSYSSKSQPLINTAMARVNRWVTKFPSAQSGGSTSLIETGDRAVLESARSRDTLRNFGVHILRHAMGSLGSLNYFSQEKFVRDCEMERKSIAAFAGDPESVWVQPLYLPEDLEAMAGIREIAEKGNPKYADHTLRNVESFVQWENRLKKNELS